MARERKAVSEMTVAEATVEFGVHLSDAQNARFHMGACFIRLTELLGSKTAAVAHLQNAFPNAKDRLGGTALSMAELNRMAETYRTLGETGIASPDGLYRIDHNDIAVLGLSNAQVNQLANAIAAERVKVKDVLREVKRARGGHAEQNAEKVEKARSNVMELVAPTRELSHAEKVVAIQESIRKQQERIDKARAEIVRLQNELRELQQQVQPTAAVAEVVAAVQEQAAG